MAKKIRYDHEGNQLDVVVEPGEALERSVGFADSNALVDVHLVGVDGMATTREMTVGQLSEAFTRALAQLARMRTQFNAADDDTEVERDAMVDVMGENDEFLTKLGAWTGE